MDVERERKVRFQHQDSSPFDEEVPEEEAEEEVNTTHIADPPLIADLSEPESAQNTPQKQNHESADKKASSRDDGDDDLLNITP